MQFPAAIGHSESPSISVSTEGSKPKLPGDSLLCPRFQSQFDENFEESQKFRPTLERKQFKHPELHFQVIQLENIPEFITELREYKNISTHLLPERVLVVLGNEFEHKTALDILIERDGIHICYLDAAGSIANYQSCLNATNYSDIEVTFCSGGSDRTRIQKDMTSCDFFAIDFLCKSGINPQFHEMIKLKRIADEETSHSFCFSLLDLPPEFGKHSQSTPFRTTYLGRHKDDSYATQIVTKEGKEPHTLREYYLSHVDQSTNKNPTAGQRQIKWAEKNRQTAEANCLVE